MMKNSFKVKISEILYFVVMCVICIFDFPIIMYIADEISIRQSNKCIENGGTVVTDTAGYFESCVYGGNNE